MNIKRFSSPPDYYLDQLKTYEKALGEIQDELKTLELPTTLKNKVTQLHLKITQDREAREARKPPRVPPLQSDI